MTRGVASMKHLISMAILVAAVITPPTIQAAPAEAQNPARLGGPLVDGSVIRTRGCGSHFFITYRQVFVLAEWLGGDMVKDGDVLQGIDDQVSFEREGRMTFTNLATGRTIDVAIEKTLMNHADYSRTAGQVCR
jgi:hypothetical protein